MILLIIMQRKKYYKIWKLYMENNSKLSKEEQLKRIQQQKLHNEKLAVKFPEWDLLPPALLVQRKTKL